MATGLNPRQERFVAEYLIDLNATQAAVRAGYSAKTARKIGSRLLTKEDIRTTVDTGRQRQLEETGLSAVRVLEELRRVALSNVKVLFDDHGDLKPIPDLTPEQAASIASVEVVKKNLTAGDGQVDTVLKIRLWDKPRALEMLAKHFALLTDVVKVEADAGALVARLLAGRRRAAGLAP